MGRHRHSAVCLGVVLAAVASSSFATGWRDWSDPYTGTKTALEDLAGALEERLETFYLWPETNTINGASITSRLYRLSPFSYGDEQPYPVNYPMEYYKREREISGGGYKTATNYYQREPPIYAPAAWIRAFDSALYSAISFQYPLRPIFEVEKWGWFDEEKPLSEYAPVVATNWHWYVSVQRWEEAGYVLGQLDAMSPADVFRAAGLPIFTNVVVTDRGESYPQTVTKHYYEGWQNGNYETERYDPPIPYSVEEPRYTYRTNYYGAFTMYYPADPTPDGEPRYRDILVEVAGGSHTYHDRRINGSAYPKIIYYPQELNGRLRISDGDTNALTPLSVTVNITGDYWKRPTQTTNWERVLGQVQTITGAGEGIHDLDFPFDNISTVTVSGVRSSTHVQILTPEWDEAYIVFDEVMPVDQYVTLDALKERKAVLNKLTWSRRPYNMTNWMISTGSASTNQAYWEWFSHDTGWYNPTDREPLQWDLAYFTNGGNRVTFGPDDIFPPPTTEEPVNYYRGPLSFALNYYAEGNSYEGTSVGDWWAFGDGEGGYNDAYSSADERVYFSVSIRKSKMDFDALGNDRVAGTAEAYARAWPTRYKDDLRTVKSSMQLEWQRIYYADSYSPVYGSQSNVPFKVGILDNYGRARALQWDPVAGTPVAEGFARINIPYLDLPTDRMAAAYPPIQLDATGNDPDAHYSDEGPYSGRTEDVEASATHYEHQRQMEDSFDAEFTATVKWDFQYMDERQEDE